MEEFKPRQEQSLRETYQPLADSNGFISLSAFSTKELKRQTKNVASLLDGSEGENLGEGLKYQGESGNYSDMKIHIDDLEEFLKRVNEFYKQ